MRVSRHTLGTVDTGLSPSTSWGLRTATSGVVAEIVGGPLLTPVLVFPVRAVPEVESCEVPLLLSLSVRPSLGIGETTSAPSCQ